MMKTDVLDVPISQIVKAPVSPSKASVRKQNQVQSKKKRRKMESSDDENSETENA
ncbi:nipped-B protein-like [Drosophila subpulchrella]|uniref:nipped-B protein-like n=1 Tax=Drosophila subpulchrella TaxID=1486046 RepID=UPI0018A188EC|nr:nipped-B protein-like [Drosophila subpulchrella]